MGRQKRGWKGWKGKEKGGESGGAGKTVVTVCPTVRLRACLGLRTTPSLSSTFVAACSCISKAGRRSKVKLTAAERQESRNGP
eukprot:452986-Hanusia_phi.AAC.1